MTVRLEDAETLEAAGDALMRAHYAELAVKLYALALRVRAEVKT